MEINITNWIGSLPWIELSLMAYLLLRTLYRRFFTKRVFLGRQSASIVPPAIYAAQSTVDEDAAVFGSSSIDINPATGLPMINGGGVDVHGNAYGSSFMEDSFHSWDSFDSSNSYGSGKMGHE